MHLLCEFLLLIISFGSLCAVTELGAAGWSLWKLQRFVFHLLYYEVVQEHFRCDCAAEEMNHFI